MNKQSVVKFGELFLEVVAAFSQNWGRIQNIDFILNLLMGRVSWNLLDPFVSYK